MKRKLKAFTLMELLIGMIISSIIIGFSYSGYRIIYSQFLDHKKVKKSILETAAINSILNNDFSNAQLIWTNDENQLDVYYNDKRELHYEFQDEYILRRDNEIIDTFNIGAQNIQKKILFGNDYDYKNLTTEFSFESVILGEKETFHFAKTYSAETLINIEGNGRD